MASSCQASKCSFSLKIESVDYAGDIKEKSSNLGFSVHDVASDDHVNISKEFLSVKELNKDLKKLYKLFDYHETFSSSGDKEIEDLHKVSKVLGYNRDEDRSTNKHKAVVSVSDRQADREDFSAPTRADNSVFSEEEEEADEGNNLDKDTNSERWVTVSAPVMNLLKERVESKPDKIDVSELSALSDFLSENFSLSDDSHSGSRAGESRQGEFRREVDKRDDSLEEFDKNQGESLQMKRESDPRGLHQSSNFHSELKESKMLRELHMSNLPPEMGRSSNHAIGPNLVHSMEDQTQGLNTKQKVGHPLGPEYEEMTRFIVKNSSTERDLNGGYVAGKNGYVPVMGQHAPDERVNERKGFGRDDMTDKKSKDKSEHRHAKLSTGAEQSGNRDPISAQFRQMSLDEDEPFEHQRTSGHKGDTVYHQLKQSSGHTWTKNDQSEEFSRQPFNSRDMERSSYGKTQVEHTHKELFTMNKKICVMAIEADITKLKVDVVVNAANGKLQHLGGVARAIATQGGKKVVQECDEFVKQNVFLQVTELFVSSGGNLPASKIFHAVGPTWVWYGEMKRDKCTEDLRWTVLRCLVEAAKQGQQSIALPSISAAISGVPLDVCVKAYLEAVQIFDTLDDMILRSSLEEIYFVDIDQRLVNNIRQYFIDNWNKVLPARVIHDGNIFAEECIKSKEPYGPNGNYSQQRNARSLAHRPASPSRNARSRSSPSRQSSRTDYQLTIGALRVSISSEPVLRQNPDLVLVFGDLNWQMFGMNLDKQVLEKSVLQRGRNTYTLYCFHGNTHVAQFCQQQSFRISMDEEYANACKFLPTILQTIKSMSFLVLTSSSLYTDDKNPRNGINRALVENFTDNALKLLKQHQDRLFSGGRGSLKIAASSDVTKIIYEKFQRITSRSSGATARPLPAAGQSSEQPHGTMKVAECATMLQGTSRKSYLITYSATDSKVMGQKLTAYLPASDEAEPLLHLLQVAYLRGLVFTTKESTKPRKSRVVTWKDIPHKTSPSGGGLYGYPDNTYPKRLAGALERKGVTTDTMTSSEMSIIYQGYKELYYTG